MAYVRASQGHNDNGNHMNPSGPGRAQGFMCMPQQTHWCLCVLKLPSITVAGPRTLQRHYLLAGVQAGTGVGKQWQGCGDEWGNTQFPLQIVE